MGFRDGNGVWGDKEVPGDAGETKAPVENWLLMRENMKEVPQKSTPLDTLPAQPPQSPQDDMLRTRDLMEAGVHTILNEDRASPQQRAMLNRYLEEIQNPGLTAEKLVEDTRDITSSKTFKSPDGEGLSVDVMNSMGKEVEAYAQRQGIETQDHRVADSAPGSTPTTAQSAFSAKPL